MGKGDILWSETLNSSKTVDLKKTFDPRNVLKTLFASYSRQVFNYLDPILIYISLWIDCLFEIRKIAVCFLWLSLPGHYRVTDEALLAETT